MNAPKEADSKADDKLLDNQSKFCVSTRIVMNPSHRPRSWSK